MPVFESRMSSKGQLTVPAAVREHFGLKPGDRVDFYLGRNGAVRIRARNKSLLDMVGILAEYAKGMPPATDADIDQAVGEQVAEDDERIQREWKEWQEFQDWRRQKQAEAAE